MSGAPSMESLCRNCATPLEGPYCSACGQKDAEVAKPLATVIADFFDNTFALDSRVLRTIGLLIVYPGRLTRAYLDGQRARYMPPVRLFVVCSLLFFAAAALSGRHVMRIGVAPSGSDTLREQPATMMLTAETEIQTSSAAARVPAYQAHLTMFPRADDPVEQIMRPRDLERLLSEPELPPVVREILRRVQRAVTEPAAFNAQLNVWLPRMMLLLIPVFAVIFRLFYWGSGIYLANHIFFAFHFHSFVFVLLTLTLAVVPLFGGPFAGIVFGVATAGYLLMSMRVVYAQSWALTFAKWLAVSLIYAITFSTALLLTLMTAIQQL